MACHLLGDKPLPRPMMDKIANVTWRLKVRVNLEMSRGFVRFVEQRHLVNENTWNHDDVIKWKHFPRYRHFVRGAIDAELWCFLWCAPEETVEQAVEVTVIWDAMTSIVTSL